MFIKGTLIILFVSGLAFSCSNKDPGRVYMPDMFYSRAVETYSSTEHLKEAGIHYNGMQVPGTVARGEMPAFPFPMDIAPDTTNYVASKAFPNPVPNMSEDSIMEGERLYLVNCAICHGTKLDGNGPLWNNGEGPYPAAPKNLVNDPIVSKQPDGQMFYVITYGKGQMGSYASQLSTMQRWMVINYINTVRFGTGTAKTDTTQKVDSAARVP